MSNVISARDAFGFFEICSERHGDDHVIALTGELDLSDADRVSAEIVRVEDSDARHIILDLSGLQFIDTSGVRLIVEADARSRVDGNRLRLRRGPQAVQRVFEITGLSDRLPFIEEDPP